LCPPHKCQEVIIVTERSGSGVPFAVDQIDHGENERGNQTRLMKVKDMILAEAIREKRERDEAALKDAEQV
ncbi:MAG: hypothetical protein IJI40_07485, partial [Firmicutes bacterium]|nr:hypothetical protein [Bacillota bacterium]